MEVWHLKESIKPPVCSFPGIRVDGMITTKRV
jgi:hypothetical protein